MSDTIEMASTQTKESNEDQKAVEPASVAVQYEWPSTWKYKSYGTFFGHVAPYFASPEVQLFFVAIISFLGPGLYNALNGLGGAGQVTAYWIDLTQTALYATFAVVSFTSGSVVNRLGVRYTLLIGSSGYLLYTSSLLCYNHTQNAGFLVFSGVVLGASAPLLWTAQGVVMISYPDERLRGRFISWFWALFNLGAVTGSIIPLAANSHTTSSDPVSDRTYIVILVLMVVGCLVPLAMCNGNEIRRSDGSGVGDLPMEPTWLGEIWGLWSTLRSELYIIALFPMFLSSNWFYAYQYSDVNLANFDTRTRALNNLVYWIAQIVGAFAFGISIDTMDLRRSLKAFVSWIALCVLAMGVWGVGYAWQSHRPSREALDSSPDLILDWKSGDFYKGFLIYVAYGFFDAVWQSAVYWYIGAITNSSRKSANIAGFYKGVQSAGAAISWRLDSYGTSYMTQSVTNWVLIGLALVFAFPVICYFIKDYQEESDPAVPVNSEKSVVKSEDTPIVPNPTSNTAESGEANTTVDTQNDTNGIKDPAPENFSFTASHPSLHFAPAVSRPLSLSNTRRKSQDSVASSYSSNEFEEQAESLDFHSGSSARRRPRSGMSMKEFLENSRDPTLPRVPRSVTTKSRPLSLPIIPSKSNEGGDMV